MSRDLRSNPKDRVNSDSEPPAWAVALQSNADNEMKAFISEQMKSSMETLDAHVSALLSPILEANQKLSRDVVQLTEKVDHQQALIKHMRASCDVTKERLIKLESYSMRENIIISGLDEPGQETDDTLYDDVMALFFEQLLHLLCIKP